MRSPFVAAALWVWATWSAGAAVEHFTGAAAGLPALLLGIVIGVAIAGWGSRRRITPPSQMAVRRNESAKP